jgi:hypothetical protein
LLRCSQKSDAAEKEKKRKLSHHTP